MQVARAERGGDEAEIPHVFMRYLSVDNGNRLDDLTLARASRRAILYETEPSAARVHQASRFLTGLVG